MRAIDEVGRRDVGDESLNGGARGECEAFLLVRGECGGFEKIQRSSHRVGVPAAALQDCGQPRREVRQLAQPGGGSLPRLAVVMPVGQIEQFQKPISVVRVERGDFCTMVRRVVPGIEQAMGEVGHAAETGVDEPVSKKSQACGEAQRGKDGPGPAQPLQGNSGREFLIEAQDHQQSGGEGNEINSRGVDHTRRESGPDIQRDEHEGNDCQREARGDSERVEHRSAEPQPVESAVRGHAEQRGHQQQPQRNQTKQDGRHPAIVAQVFRRVIPEHALQRQQKDECGEGDAHIAGDLDEGGGAHGWGTTRHAACQ